MHDPAPLTPRTYSRKRPNLTAEGVVDYLDWTLENLAVMAAQTVDVHLRAAELVIRTRATDAQAKATQHTLVESGIIDQPNA